MFQVEKAGTRLPLVELGDHLFGITEIEVVETLDHTPGGIAEQGRFLVVPVAGNGVHPEVPPAGGKDFVLIRKKTLEIHQDGIGFSGNVPASYPHSDSLGGRLSLPGLEKSGVLQEIRIFL